jgi:hypothetical protein
MAKKRKLNSKNPKYLEKVSKGTETNQEKRLMCNASVRDMNGNIVEGVVVPVCGIFGQD